MTRLDEIRAEHQRMDGNIEAYKFGVNLAHGAFTDTHEHRGELLAMVDDLAEHSAHETDELIKAETKLDEAEKRDDDHRIAYDKLRTKCKTLQTKLEAAEVDGEELADMRQIISDQKATIERVRAEVDGWNLKSVEVRDTCCRKTLQRCAKYIIKELDGDV
jgi:chromosome segregation ATPase